MYTGLLILVNSIKFKILVFSIIFVICFTQYCTANNTDIFEGKFFKGEGDVEQTMVVHGFSGQVVNVFPTAAE